MQHPLLCQSGLRIRIKRTKNNVYWAKTANLVWSGQVFLLRSDPASFFFHGRMRILLFLKFFTRIWVFLGGRSDLDFCSRISDGSMYSRVGFRFSFSGILDPDPSNFHPGAQPWLASTTARGASSRSSASHFKVIMLMPDFYLPAPYTHWF